MQKKLLLLIAMSFSMMYADYIDDLIVEYNKTLSTTEATIDGVYAAQQADNETKRTEARSHQCNGRHIFQPDEKSVTGQEHAKIEEEYQSKTKTNKELRDIYKDNGGFNKELEHRIYVMESIYLDALDKCGKDSSCLRKHDAPAWEEMSKPGFMQQRFLMVYEPVLYHGKVVLNREQKENLAADNSKIKELVEKLNKVKQEVQDKIDDLMK